MASTLLPVAVPVVSNPIAIAESWFKVHEKLLIVVMVLAFGVFVVQKGFNLAATYEGHKAQQANTVLQAQTNTNDAALMQAKASLVDYQNALELSNAQNANLSIAIAKRTQTLVVQQATDKKLAPSQLALRWQSLIGDPGVQADETGYQLTNDGALATIGQLEQVPVLKQNVTDEQSQITNLQTDVTKANDLINQGKIVVSGLQLQLTDANKACTAQLEVAKSSARKGKLKAFGWGVVTGFVGGLVLHVF